MKKKSGTEYLQYGRHIIRGWADETIEGLTQDEIRVLDIGCGQGDDLMEIQKASSKNIKLCGFEYYPEYQNICREKGIEVSGVDIERDEFPYKENALDIVSINQVVEHLKDVFYVFSEISRILRPGGTLIVGVPNLAAYHDRICLILGQQPTNIKMLGGHVRGITIPAFKKFIEEGGFFKVKDVKGSGFMPLPEKPSLLLAKWFPGLASSIFFKIERTDKPGAFIEVLDENFFETNYYRGKPKVG